MNCRLCELVENPDSRVYYEDNRIIVMDGLKKDNYQEKRMCILKRHSKNPTGEEIRYMISKCFELRTKFGGRWDVVIGMYSLPNHFHVHLGKV